MLISHRRSAYIDDDELERSAGMFEIAAESEHNTIDRSYYAGAACVLRAMNAHDVKTCSDLMTIFRRTAFDITTNGEGTA